MNLPPITLLATLLLLSLPVSAADPALTGRQIVDEVSKRHDKPNEFEVQEITLIDKSGATEQRELQRYKRDMGDKEIRHLLLFTAPSGVKGVGLLTWQHNGAPDDQWLYLPAAGPEMKRIAKGGRKNYFMGTDYTFEDLTTEEKDQFSYERLPDEDLDGAKCFVVKSVATDPELQKETGYGFHKFWISQDRYFIVQIEFYDTHGDKVKRERLSDLVAIEGQAFRANKIEMENFGSSHKTLTVVHERSFKEADVPEKNFKESNIVDGSLLH